MSNAEIAASIHDDALSLYASYKDTLWNDNEGELVGGLLSITIGSSDFWRTNYKPGGYFGGPLGLPNLIQLDAGGYLWGWGKRWIHDANSTASDRINAGLEEAAEVSSLGLFG